MRLVVGVGVIMGGAMLASAHGTVSYVQADRTGKHFGFNNRQQQQQNYGNSLQQQLQQLQQQQGYSSNNNNNQQQQNYNTADYNTLLQQYAALASASSSGNANSAYYDVYADTGSDYAQDYLPAAAYPSTTVSESSDSSPALSALALLGFLYFLNLIQDVLQNNGRKRRSVDPYENTNETYYSTTYQDVPNIVSPEGDFKQEGLKHLKEEDVKEAVLGKKDENDSPYLETITSASSHLEEELGRSSAPAGNLKESEELASRVQEDSPRSFSFLENFFIKLPQALGLIRRRRPIDRDGREDKPMTVGNYITSRIKMISSIMSFLQNPSPLRIRRDTQDEGSTDTLDLILGALNALFFETDEDIQSGKGKDTVGDNMTEGGFLERFRRFTHSMNAWYDDLGGRNFEPSTTSEKVAAKVTSILGGGSNLQEAVKKDAVPAFLELSKSLDGHHPHCLQRALCRMNSHTHSVSFIPRLAIQFFSNQLSSSTSNSDGLEKANQRAMAVGREGLDCEKEFPDCNA